MSAIERLPTELVCEIAEFTTWDIRWNSRSLSAFYASHHAHAAFARTSRHFYAILNPLLYRRNLTRDHPLNSCIFWAAKEGRLDTIKVAHSYGADLNANGSTSDRQWAKPQIGHRGTYLRCFATPLHLAIEREHSSVVEYLLENGANFHAPSKNLCQCKPGDGQFPYPLHTALMYHKSKESVRHFASILVNKGAYLLAEGVPAIYTLATFGFMDLVEVLLPHTNARTVNEILRLMAERGNLDAVSRLLEHPLADVNDTDVENGETALHTTITHSQQAVLQLLLEQPNLDISLQDRLGYTPLHRALNRFPPNQEGAMLLLQQPGINVTAIDQYARNPLHWAVQHNTKQTIDILLACPNIDIHTSDNLGYTLLHLAAMNRSMPCQDVKDTIDALLNRGISIDAVAPSHGTALYCAVQETQYHNALHLLSRGAEPLVQHDGMRWSLLHCCVVSEDGGESRIQLVKELLHRRVPFDEKIIELEESGEDEDVSDECYAKSAGTPLFFAAAEARSLECMKMLLDTGADPSSMVVNKNLWPITSNFGGYAEEQLFLPALFRHIWPQSNVSDDDIQGKVKDCISLLVEHGSCIGAGGAGQSALEFACDRCIGEGESYALLTLLLEKATAVNVNNTHIKWLISNYKQHERVVQALKGFANSWFPKGAQEEEGDK